MFGNCFLLTWSWTALRLIFFIFIFFFLHLEVGAFNAFESFYFDCSLKAVEVLQKTLESNCSCFNNTAAYDNRTLLQELFQIGGTCLCTVEIRSECTNITFSSFSSPCNNSFCFPSAPDVPVLNTALFASKQVRTWEMFCSSSRMLYSFLLMRIL